MSKTVAFLAETPGSASIERQEACLGPDDLAVLAGNRTFYQLGELLARSGVALETGDHVKVYDLTCLGLSTSMLTRVLTKLLRGGISVEIVAPGIVIKPGGSDGQKLLDALDGHYRHLHGIKTHPAETAAPKGRRRLLETSQLGEIQTMLEKPGATATSVARDLGVGRSTLFAYLERHDASRRHGRSK